MNDSKQDVILTPYHPKYGEQTVSMWRQSKERALGQKEIHSFEKHVHFINHIVHKKYEVEIALLHETVVGMIAYNEEEIDQLYIHVDYQGFGIGSTLLHRAKEQSSGKLSLYTFEVNKNAQRFYEKYGFTIIGRGHENEENLPDILYEWVDN
ncbi:GNAT family N-acetyltransferase [Guptibacillus algicola]|uniref:GNAT family N-acetyltransferase n=1 Tax=Guptibacillus algicola TaxID=225844 RepID=UPI001CD1CFA0|nr:GNAT family N-acetyltransferase [Alkalihalobacillus algicola]MCA0987244.1 GNAT family N-acetyltransferase [Alkalihalobacillus algicola]